MISSDYILINCGSAWHALAGSRVKFVNHACHCMYKNHCITVLMYYYKAFALEELQAIIALCAWMHTVV